MGLFKKKPKVEVVYEPLPEGKATAEIMLRKTKDFWGIERYEFYAQVVSARGFEERHLIQWDKIIGHEKVVYEDVIEHDSNFKRAYYLQLRKMFQEEVLNKLTQDLVAEGFTPTHARGEHWFSIRFERG